MIEVTAFRSQISPIQDAMHYDATMFSADILRCPTWTPRMRVYTDGCTMPTHSGTQDKPLLKTSDLSECDQSSFGVIVGIVVCRTISIAIITQDRVVYRSEGGRNQKDATF